MFSQQGGGRNASNLREAILKRLPFPRPRSSSDSCIESSTRRPVVDPPSSSVSNAGSAEDVRKAEPHCEVLSPNKDSVKSITLSRQPKQERIIEKEVPGIEVQDDDGSLCFSGTPDSNVLSKVSNSTSHFSGSNSSSMERSHKTQNSSNSCSSCCSKLSAELSHDKKSPVIHVKLYSTHQSLDGTGGSTGSKRHSHVLCHKVPLTSLSCCSECRTEENGDVAPCLCTSQVSNFTIGSESDKKSTCSSIHSNVVCNCAEEISCTCTKGSQITCEVDLVFEGENVKNVPMKNEIMEVDVTNSLSLINKTADDFGEYVEAQNN